MAVTINGESRRSTPVNGSPARSSSPLTSATPKNPPAWIKWVVLVWLTAQNSVHTLVVRHSRARHVPEMFLASAAVFWTEIVKLVICLAAIVVEERGPTKAATEIFRVVVLSPMDTLKVCVPSFIYTLQNNLFYMAASHLEAATFMVVCQLKIFTTAMFSVTMLGRSLSRSQWLALFLLFVGVSMVQVQQQSQKQTNEDQKPLVGFLCVVIASIMSGFSGVYFEKILKGSAPISVMMRNVQLAVCSIPISFLTMISKDYTRISEHGILVGFDSFVWFVVFWYGIGGLTVALCIKYADNIAKNFSTSVAIIIATVASIFIFDFVPDLLFVSGASIVIASIFLYSKPGNRAVVGVSSPTKEKSEPLIPKTIPYILQNEN